MGKGAKRAARVMAKREPQLIEGQKSLLVLRGSTSSETVTGLARDLAILKKPNARVLTRKNDIHPMEDATSLEFLLQKNDCSAFLFTSHSKKRPHNLVLGRTFDDHFLDVIELGVTAYASISDFKGSKKVLGSYPCFVFNGEEWDRSKELKKLRSMVLDTFSGRDITGVSLAGIDNVISLTEVDGTIYWRTYFVSLKRSNSKLPRVALSNMGPHMNLVLRRTQFASSDLEKQSLKQPKENIAKKEKNVETDVFGETHGRIHMQREDFSKLQLNKSLTGLNKYGNKRKRAVEEGEGESEAGAEEEESAVGASSSSAAAMQQEELDGADAPAANSSSAGSSKKAKKSFLEFPKSAGSSSKKSAQKTSRSPAAGGKKARFGKK